VGVLTSKVVGCVMLLFLCSCTRTYYVDVDTYADRKQIPNGFPPGSSFVVLPDETDVGAFSKEMTQKIDQMLEDRGYDVVSANKADYYLVFKTSMTSAESTVCVPIYTPGSSQTTTGNVYGSRGHASYSETTKSSGTTDYVNQSYTYFIRGVGLHVYDAHTYRKHKKEDLIWSGIAISSGSNSDFRDVVDYLLVSVFKYFGDNTKKSVSMTISADDERVEKLRSNLGDIIPSGVSSLLE